MSEPDWRPSCVTYFVWQDLLQSFSTQPAGLQLLPGLLCGLALHQSLRLGKEVGHQDLHCNGCNEQDDMFTNCIRQRWSERNQLRD